MKAELGRLRTIYKAFQTFHRGEIECKYPPQITNIELTTRCNLNCVFCARETVRKNRGFGDMPYNEYKGIIDKYKDSVRNLRLFRHGEPTLYPKIVDAVQYAAEKDYVKSVGFTTNGNFDTGLVKELFEAGLTVIEFSFEGISPEIYRSQRGGGDFTQVYVNIQNALLWKLKYPKVTVRINIIENDATAEGMEEFLDHWRNFPLTVDVARLHDWGGNKDLTGIGAYDRNFLPPSCFSAWFTASILYNGSVVPCCSWFNDPMGNVFKKDLLRIWNDYPFQSLRWDLAKGRKFNVQCKKCYIHPLNKSPYQITERNPYFPFDPNLIKVLWDAAKVRLRRNQPKLRRVKH